MRTVLSQLWLSIVAPIVGGAFGGLLYRYLIGKAKVETEIA